MNCKECGKDITSLVFPIGIQVFVDMKDYTIVEYCIECMDRLIQEYINDLI